MSLLILCYDWLQWAGQVQVVVRTMQGTPVPGITVRAAQGTQQGGGSACLGMLT